MMFISKESLDQRLKSEIRDENEDENISLNHNHNNSTLVIRNLGRRGRRFGQASLPESVKTLIGITAKLSTQKASAIEFGVSQASAGLYEKGKSSTFAAAPIDEAKVQEVENGVASVRGKALKALLDSTHIIGDRIHEGTKTKDLSALTSALCKIVNISSPNEKINQNKLVIIAPPQRREDLYDIIDA